ncbi:Gfo/Idh/MocA family protein [uncultured Tenacibaculum sp.]|uniref:Gfo/Idh/MocA family oxidoreductase n=1 Tax=uncultured Tenacibaculum sp. TaxID=174713 RepID=UPI002605A3E2|nr:Gfo/Idh/MocA family oxidoreductase [uncultured Tenacibaculum sp.]
MKNFAVIGVAGYIAERHLRAIKDTGNNLVASLDKNDSVGILDSYFPKSNFFVEFERFDRYIERLKRQENVQLDYVSVCTPNYLHDSHIRMALRRGADAICEKPLVLNPWNIDALEAIEAEGENSINAVLQLRLHSSVIALKNKIINQKKTSKYEIDLTYITSRGNWYGISWKGDESKSGGIITNIGIHFFDMLTWIFGKEQESHVYLREFNKASGYLELENARVRWFLSIDEGDLSNEIITTGKRTYRSIVVDGEELEFSDGFTDLHTKTYQEILRGRGFSLQEARASIETVYNIRNTKIINKGFKHPYLCK